MKQVMKSATLVVAILSISFAFQGCNSAKMIDKSKLEGHWVLETLEGKNAKTEYAGQAATLQFDFDKNSISGTSGCNNYNGGFNLNNKNEFSAPNLASTMKMCMNMDIENAFSRVISTPDMILSLNENGVLSFDKGGKSVLTFKIGEKPILGLVPINLTTIGGEWKLVNIEGGDVAGLFGEKVPTMTISPEGKVSGFAGCNRYNTTVKIEGEQLTFTPPMSTRMACDHIEGEGKYTTLLTNTLKATLVGNKLSLSNSAGIIVLEYVKG